LDTDINLLTKINMKAIQSFRSDNIRPALESFGGPSLLKARIMLMALSAASIARYYPDFSYITDDAGKYMAEECKFPYTEIVSVGNNFDSSMLFWVHSKFTAYECKKPFLHFDNDIILWNPLPDRIHKADIVALHGESFMWPHYEMWIRDCEKAIPELLQVKHLWAPYFTNHAPINMAIFGGNDTNSINKYASEVLEIIKGPLKSLRHVDLEKISSKVHLMPIVEQLWASYILQSKYNKQVTCVLTEHEYTNKVPKEDVKFTHFHGSKLYLQNDPKGLIKVNYQIEKHLKAINPEFYSAVNKFTSSPTNIDSIIESTALSEGGNMIRIAPYNSHEDTDEGLKVYLEGDSKLAMTSPEAQKLVFNYAKSAGFNTHGLNKFVAISEKISNTETFSQRGYWILLPTKWNKNSIRV